MTRMTCSMTTIEIPRARMLWSSSHGRFCLGRRQTCHHLIEQQEKWLGCQCSRNLEPLAIRNREIAGERVLSVNEARELKRGQRDLARRRIFA